MTAEQMSLKDQGNAEFKAGSYLKAAATYTKAIKADPENEVLYSNRCAALTHLKKIVKAVADADMCIKLKPTWEKGYFRKGAALEAGERMDEALEAYREAAELNPKNSEVAVKIKNITRLIRNRKREEGSLPKEGGFIKSDEDYTEAKKNMGKGEAIAVDEQRILSFAKETISSAINQFVETEGNLDPCASFLPGTRDASNKDGETIGVVAIKQAFENPDMLANCVEFLRQYGSDMKAHAACMVVPREAVSFPQVWKKTGKKGWKFGDKTGFFVQLDSPKVKRMWFVPSGKESGKLIPQGAESLDYDDFKLVPPLFR